MHVHIVCRNWQDDRVLPRFARYLVEHNGWTVSDQPVPTADLNYWMAYFEWDKHKGFDATPTVAYLTHLEDASAAESAKVRLFHNAASHSDLRVAMNEHLRAQVERAHGPTLRFPLPLERDRFARGAGTTMGALTHAPVVGFSGFRYKSGRKGEDLAGQLVQDFDNLSYMASGRGWPCKTTLYRWEDMPSFYRGLDIFVCTSLVEGGPMTTLEALACGVPVVIPRDVGIHNELPDTHGIYRYPKGSYKGLKQAMRAALGDLGSHDPEELRAATQPHGVQAWCAANQAAFEHFLYDKAGLGPLELREGNRGIYMVAFGKPARDAAKLAIRSIRANLPNVPVALVSDKKLGPEHILIKQPDKDIGGRIAKLKVYDLAPKEWEAVLYLDADVEVQHADAYEYFRWLAQGWEYIICKDAHLKETLADFERSNNKTEFYETIEKAGTAESLQINGGVWGFRRCPIMRRFFARWYDEWAKYKGRDQGALIRAMYTEPMRVLWLGNEWNTLVTLKDKEYHPGIKGSAGVVHYVGRARRWEGQVPTGHGLDDPVAWKMVEAWERKHGID